MAVRAPKSADGTGLSWGSVRRGGEVVPRSLASGGGGISGSGEAIPNPREANTGENQGVSREETAATRSLLNTARVMEDNPTALRLKELETLEKVTEKIDKISVFGGLDGVLKDLVKIR